MNFLTEDKANWKHILIMAILVVMVGGGVLGYCQWIKKEVKIPEIETPEVKYIEIWPKFVPAEKRCEGIFDLVKLEECYADFINSAKETRGPFYCRSIPDQFLYLRWDCYRQLAISNDDLLLCENIEDSSLFSLCIKEYFGEKAKETAGWKTFKNEVFGYEVKYPPDWKTDFQDKSLLLFIDTENLLLEGIEGGEYYEEAIAIFATSSLSSKELKDIYHITYIYPAFFKTFSLQIGGAETEVICRVDPGSPATIRSAYSILRKENIVLDVRSTSPSATFFQILSTLKFFEPTEESAVYRPGKYAVSEWKTYKDEDSKFQIDYPNGWVIEIRCAFGDSPGSISCTGNEFSLPFIRDELYLHVGAIIFESEEYAKAFCEGGEGEQYYLEKVIVGGIEGTKYFPIKPEPGDTIEVGFARRNYCYRIFSPFELGDVLNHILSTFRFLD